MKTGLVKCDDHKCNIESSCLRYLSAPSLDGQEWGIYWHDAQIAEGECPWLLTDN